MDVIFNEEQHLYAFVASCSVWSDAAFSCHSRSACSIGSSLGPIAGTLVAAAALVYTIRSLTIIRRQTEASVATSIETFRPIIEVLGGELAKMSRINFKNKGNGAALNFRWGIGNSPSEWQPFTTNIIAPNESGTLTGQIDWKHGLTLSYNSAAHVEEILHM